MSIRGQKKKISKKLKKKIMHRLILIVAPIIIVATVVIISSISSYIYYLSMMSAVNETLSLWGKEDNTTETKPGEIVVEEDQPKYGIYPVDDTIRIKQEMMEICELAGKQYNISGKLVLAVAMSETSAYAVPILDGGGTSSLYTNITLNHTKNKNGSFYVAGGNIGKYKNKNGNKIVDPLKVGSINKISGATGPFQFEGTYITGNVTRMLNIKDGVGIVTDKMETMGWFDKELGFMRPHPLYFPDAAINAAYMIATRMNTHKSELDDVVKSGLPQEIKNEILFIYATDAYRGDMEAKSKGTEAKQMHDSMAELYADIYDKYSKVNPNIKSLGDFSLKEYNQPAIRTLIAGVQFDKYNFDGTFNYTSKVVKKDGESKYITIGGIRYYKSLIDKFSNTSKYNINYKKYLETMKVGGTGFYKFGLLHGFQGLNAVAYHWNLWTEEIALADKGGVIGGGQIITGEIPYITGTNSREEMLTAAFAVVGKVRYVWGGGHGGSEYVTTINPLWRQFNNIYLSNNKSDKCIRPNASGYWCPIHNSKNKDNRCAFNGPTYSTSATLLSDRKVSFAKYGNPYGGITELVLESALQNANKGQGYHTYEGLDCSGFVSWVYNQTITSKKYSPGSTYVNANGMTSISISSKVLPGDVIDWSGHIIMIVGSVDNSNSAFLIIEAAPPHVKFGVAYKEGASKEAIKAAKQVAMEANNYFGGIPTNSALSLYGIDGKRIGRPSTQFTDAGTENKLAGEIVDIMRKRLTTQYKGR